MRILVKTLRNFALANVCALIPLWWVVLGWMPDQVKVWMRGWNEAPGVIAVNGTTLSGEEYGEWSAGRIFRFYLQKGMPWKDLVFSFPGTSGTAAVERVELQKGKLFALRKKGHGLTALGDESEQAVFSHPGFDAVGFAGGKITWAFVLLEMLLAGLSWWCARYHRAESWRTLSPPALALALTFAFLIQVALPIQSYWANRASYPFPFPALVGSVACRFAGLSALGMTSLALLSKCFGRWVFGAVLALAVCMYLEAGILSNGLASLNGDVFLLQDKTRALWDAAAWITVFAALLTMHPLLRKRYVLASSCLAAMVAASLLDAKHEKLVDKSNLLVHDFVPVETVVRNVAYSTNRNVMVFILDSLEREQAHAIMEDPEAGPELQEQFRGFIEYTNNVGALTMTLLAVPNLLTGLYPDGTDTLSDFSWSCFGPQSALRNYLETGHETFMAVSGLGCGYTTRTNGTPAAPWKKTSVLDVTGNDGDAWSIRNFTRWRWMPFAAKAVVSDLTARIANNSESVKRELGVYGLLAEAKIDPSIAGTLLWVHTYGVHVPLCWNRRGETIPFESTSERGCIEQGTFILNRLGKLLDSYRKAGIYDKSLILVLGDHGRHDERTFLPDKLAGRLPGNARPCLWVKPMGSAHEFRSVATPTSHANVATLLRAAARQNLPEKDIESILRSEKRVYRRMTVLGDGWTDWIVDGGGGVVVEEHSTSPDSGGSISPLRCNRHYSLDWRHAKDFERSVVFRNTGCATQYPYLPSDTHEASLEFRVPDTGKRYVLELDLYLSQGGSLRCRCEAADAEWVEFPIKIRGKITVHGVQANPSGIARILMERTTGPHVDVSFTGLRLTEER